MPDQLISIVAFCSLALAAFGLGRPVLRYLAIAQEDRLSVAVWSIALGTPAAGMVLLGLGRFGGLYVPAIGFLTLFACFWGLAEIFRDLILAAEQRAFPPEPSFKEEPVDAVDTAWSPPGCWLLRGILIAATIAGLSSLLGSLAPATTGDGLYRELEVSKTMLLEHRILPLGPRAALRFPSPTEMWYLWAMALDGTVCAQLVRFGLGLLLGMATVVLATPVVGRPWAWIAGAMTVLAPTVTDQIAPSPGQVATAVFATLALAAWWRVVVDKEGPRWCFLAGLTAGGAAIETRFFLPVALAAVAAWLFSARHRTGQRREELRLAALMGATVLCVAGPWLALAVWHHAQTETGQPLVASVVASFDLKTVAPGGLALAAVPGLFFTRRLRGLRVLLVAATLYGVVWLLSDRPVELLCLLVPLLSVATVWVWIEMRRFPPRARRVAGAAFGCVVAAMAVAAIVRVMDRAAVAVAVADREDYLLLREPTYRAAAVVNAMLRDETHLLSEDDRVLYFNGRVTRESDYRSWTDYAAEITNPAHLSHVLRAQGFTHLLLAETLDGHPTDNRSLSRLVDAQIATPSSERPLMLTQYTSRSGADGETRRYRLMEIR